MPVDESVYGEEIDRLDLARYGAADLSGRDLLGLTPEELERLLVALSQDDISLNLPLACTREAVFDLLALSHCRRCGRCCLPNPLNPRSPGVEVFEEELTALAEAAGRPPEELRKRTASGNTTPYAFQQVKLGFTRWLPLPCPLYDSQTGCQAYAARGMVCQVYPVIFTGYDDCISIRTTCEYGRDMIVAACHRLKADRPDLEILL